ncbi:MAG: TIGR03943 family protein [Oscillatoria sp. PMC 1068.18]|nr:TIGR03943 family protein [Oscillatoria sp. PMC 1076.18]MEC4990619.1 TIGR03943 family protein [Oscillatoria sp. PMC 1068.18]
MSSKSKGISYKYKVLFPWLDILAFLAWGGLLLKYWLTGQLQLLIHPNYFWLVLVTGIILVAIASLRVWQQLQKRRKRSYEQDLGADVRHITLFPPGLSSSLLLGVAILGLLIPPRILASDTALQRGITDSLLTTRAQPQSFSVSIQPEARSLLDWVRTLNAYPEPDDYFGQKVNVKGFVVHSEALPEQYLVISRFVITCCAVDAYPVGLPVKLSRSQNDYPPDTWLQVEGSIITEELADKRQVVIVPTSIEEIPTPKDPYEF